MWSMQQGENAFNKKSRPWLRPGSAKDSCVQYLSHGTLGSSVALSEAELQLLLCRAFFGRFRVLTNTWALMNRRKLQNPPKNNPAQNLS